MAWTASQVGAEVARRFDAVMPPGSPNRLEPDVFRAGVRWDLSCDEDAGLLPRWGLWMPHLDEIDNAVEVLFAVLVFRTDSAQFFCGAGNWSDLRRVVDRREPDQVRGLYTAFARQFRVPEPLVLFERSPLVGWIGQDWG